MARKIEDLPEDVQQDVFKAKISGSHYTPLRTIGNIPENELCDVCYKNPPMFSFYVIANFTRIEVCHTCAYGVEIIQTRQFTKHRVAQQNVS